MLRAAREIDGAPRQKGSHMARDRYICADEASLTTIRLEFTTEEDQHIDRVNGWSYQRKTGTLTLLARDQHGQRHAIWIDRLFAQRLGPLTEQIVGILDETKPQTFRADLHITWKRTEYYQPTRQEFASWTARARKEIKRAKHRAKRQLHAA